MNFGEAFQCLKENKKIYRKGWNAPGVYLHLVASWGRYLDGQYFTGDQLAIYPSNSIVTGRNVHSYGYRVELIYTADIFEDDWLIFEN